MYQKTTDSIIQQKAGYFSKDTTSYFTIFIVRYYIKEAVAKYLNSTKYSIVQTKAILYSADSRHFTTAPYNAQISPRIFAKKAYL
jgi:hypothetical protein